MLYRDFLRQISRPSVTSSPYRDQLHGHNGHAQTEAIPLKRTDFSDVRTTNFGLEFKPPTPLTNLRVVNVPVTDGLINIPDGQSNDDLLFVSLQAAFRGRLWASG